MSMETMTDEELDQHRRDILVEQERRQKLQDGLDQIGQAVHDYLVAARIETEYGPDELGPIVIDLLTKEE